MAARSALAPGGKIQISGATYPVAGIVSTGGVEDEQIAPSTIDPGHTGVAAIGSEDVAMPATPATVWAALTTASTLR